MNQGSENTAHLKGKLNNLTDTCRMLSESAGALGCRRANVPAQGRATVSQHATGPASSIDSAVGGARRSHDVRNPTFVYLRCNLGHSFVFVDID